ncbi:hypothetical protein BKA63DRAFT_558891, partial [Paraphoma chrysanthemicola]
MNARGAVIAAVCRAVGVLLYATIFAWCYPDVHRNLEAIRGALGVQAEILDLNMILRVSEWWTILLHDCVHLAGWILDTSINGALVAGHILCAFLVRLE